MVFAHGEYVQPRRVTTPMWLRAALYWGYQYKRTWRSSIFTSFLIAFFLRHYGTRGVFAFIAAAMGIVILAIGVFGPRTRGLALEDISQ